jgi:hypothetical protein
VSDVPDDADDRASALQPDDFADGVFVAEILPDRGFVEDHDGLTVLAVGLCEEPSLQQRNLERGEIVRRDLIDVDVRVLRQGAAGYSKVLRSQITAERQSPTDQRGHLYAGDGTNAVQHIPEQFTVAPDRRLEFLRTDERADPYRQHVVMVESEVHARYAGKTCEEEPRSHQQNDGQRDLGDDEGRAKPL